MIIVTGGAGFIGSNLAAALEERGERDLVICDRLGDGDKWRNIAKRELAAFVSPDALLDFLDHHARDVRAIFHLGAISSTTERDADLIIRTNFMQSLHLWQWCASHGTRFFYASSAATYGDGGAGFDDDGSPEALALLRPLNPYGWSKHIFDRRVARLVERRGPVPPQWAGFKFFNVYGPNEYHKGGMMSVAAQIFPRALAEEPCRLYRSHRPDFTDGGQLRDFVAVEDCVAMMMFVFEHEEVCGLFNAGTGQARSFADLAAAVYRALGHAPLIDYVDTPPELRERYQYRTEASMGRLRQAGYDRPACSLEDGVAAYVRSFLANPDPYR